MLNKEKYAKEIVEIACDGDCFALKNGTLCRCHKIDCKECDFKSDEISCAELAYGWANSEYIEHQIDWSKVPVDTPIYIIDENGKQYKWLRHFAKYENGMVYYFTQGRTSFTSQEIDSPYQICNSAKIKEGVDCSEWYKD